MIFLKIKNWIIKDKNLVLENDDSFYNDLKKNNELAADPLFPYFSIKPINIARVKKLNVDENKIDRYIKMVRRLKNDDV